MYFKEYDRCILCPRECGVNRNRGEKGVCGMSSELVLGRAALHMWEEPCLSGEKGSGTVFFSGCPLRCVYCQNHGLSRGREGVEVQPERLTEIFLELQQKGAHNINLVTGVHYAPHIVYSVREAHRRGLSIPMVYNSSGYESVSTLKMLDGTVDIYLPDFKYIENESAKCLSGAPDYPITAKKAIDEMLRQKPRPLFDETGLLKSGVLVRHLCLPSFSDESVKIMDYLHTYKDRIFLSIMSQYTPVKNVSGDLRLSKPLTGREYDKVVDHCIALGMENAYIQEGSAADESFIPCFDGEGVFPKK